MPTKQELEKSLELIEIKTGRLISTIEELRQENEILKQTNGESAQSNAEYFRLKQAAEKECKEALDKVVELTIRLEARSSVIADQAKTINKLISRFIP